MGQFAKRRKRSDESWRAACWRTFASTALSNYFCDCCDTHGRGKKANHRYGCVGQHRSAGTKPGTHRTRIVEIATIFRRYAYIGGDGSSGPVSVTNNRGKCGVRSQLDCKHRTIVAHDQCGVQQHTEDRQKAKKFSKITHTHSLLSKSWHNCRRTTIAQRIIPRPQCDAIHPIEPRHEQDS
jgi:hypothetical protein